MSDTTSTTPTPEATTPVEPLAPRSPAEIQSEIDAAQQRLAASVDELSERLNPQTLAEEAKHSVKRVFVDEYGSVKPKPIAIIGGTVAGLLVLRAIFHRD